MMDLHQVNHTDNHMGNQLTDNQHMVLLLKDMRNQEWLLCNQVWLLCNQGWPQCNQAWHQCNQEWPHLWDTNNLMVHQCNQGWLLQCISSPHHNEKMQFSKNLTS